MAPSLSTQVVRLSTRSDAEGRVKRLAGVSRCKQHQSVAVVALDDDIRSRNLSINRAHGWALSLPARYEPIAAYRG